MSASPTRTPRGTPRPRRNPDQYLTAMASRSTRGEVTRTRDPNDPMEWAFDKWLTAAQGLMASGVVVDLPY